MSSSQTLQTFSHTGERNVSAQQLLHKDSVRYWGASMELNGVTADYWKQVTCLDNSFPFELCCTVASILMSTDV